MLRRLTAPVTECAARRKRSRGTRTMTWAAWPRRPSPRSQPGGVGYLPNPPKRKLVFGLRRRSLRDRTDAAPFILPPGRERAGKGRCWGDGRQTRLSSSWLLSCVHFLASSMVGGRVKRMHFPEGEPPLSHYSVVLKGELTALIKPPKV